jgi:DNA primase
MEFTHCCVLVAVLLSFKVLKAFSRQLNTTVFYLQYCYFLYSLIDGKNIKTDIKLMISQQSIEQVIDSVNIVEVIGAFIDLKKAGVNYKGCCPFHDEKTPSFIVSPSKGIFKCFGCGEAGNAVQFLMKFKALSFPEAIKHLADQYSITLEYYQQNGNGKQEFDKLQRDKETIIFVNELAALFFEKQLGNSQLALDYIKKRVTDEDIITWRIGYAQDSYDSLLSYLKEKGVKEEAILMSGLIAENEKRGTLYDRFRNRIIFPIMDPAHRIIGFGGRLVPSVKVLLSDSKGPKYLNSPDTVVYNKSMVLFGLSQARKSIQAKDKCYLVEGYTDVIAMHRVGITNTVATCGTSVTDDHIKSIKKYTRHIHLLADGDKAGLRSIIKSGELCARRGLSISSTVLPDNMDPDEVIQKFELHA